MSAPLESPQLAVKYFLSDPIGVDLQELLPIFHRMIQRNVLAHELMIDVANYAHVHNGPGVMIICNTAHYSVDTRHGRPGILFAKKRESHGGVQDRLREAFRSVLLFSDLLASELELGGRYAIDTGAFEFGVMDRLLAPNTAATDDGARPVLGSFVESLYRTDDVAISQRIEPRTPFLLKVRVGGPPSTKELLARLQMAAQQWN
jgi:hypothetical protein